MEGEMWIRELSFIPKSSPTYFRAVVREAIQDLDAQYEAGELEYPSYYQRRHALERML